jgi:hypothetical protein
VKRSEYVKLNSIVYDLRRDTTAGYYYSSAEESSFDEGRQRGKESAADDIECVLDNVVVDVEDVVVCSNPNGIEMHVVGSMPSHYFLGKLLGCSECKRVTSDK